MAKTDFTVIREDTLLNYLIQYSGKSKKDLIELIKKGNVF